MELINIYRYSDLSRLSYSMCSFDTTNANYDVYYNRGRMVINFVDDELWCPKLRGNWQPLVKEDINLYPLLRKVL